MMPYPVVAVLPAPTFAATSAARLPDRVRARLWLPGRVFGPADDQPRLWLILADGRVLAFRLPGVALGDDRVIMPLVQAVADDVRGMRWEVEHPAFGWAQLLYAAPVLPALDKAHAGFLFDADYQQFAANLDGQIMRLLLSLEREPTPPAITRRDGEPPHPLPRPYFASVRNYNRLAMLPPETRARRLQALARFPALVAPILLTEHRAPNVWDGKRHAWREKDLAVEEACDAGRDLTGALARHYGISRGLVRAPLNAAYWKAPHAAMRHGWLRLLDALPDNPRPSLAEFERWQLYLANYFALLGEDDHGHLLPHPPEVHRGAFRLGWTRTWESAARRHGNLHPALADCKDFLRAARERAAQMSGRPAGPSLGRLAAGWLACHGLLGLLAASERWHRLVAGGSQWQSDIRLPALLGVIEEEGKRAEELLTPQALAREGEAMRHCVASYWPQCLKGDRIFALRLANGARATAQYELGAHPRDPHLSRYRLVQLRGPRNADVDAAMQAWARDIERRLNAPDVRPRYVEAVKVARVEYERHHHRVWQDERLERQLQRVCAWLKFAPLPPETLLAAYVAGFDYHFGPYLEDRLAPGLPLTLVREPDNPHDPLAVRIDWQNETLGYLPRRSNAEIARRLDAGEPLCARIETIDPEAESWRRILLVVIPARP
ncbi:MAG: HIRAN domain-containing protein [Rhodocyclaceae bacterium]|nr:HIRAN domain-containing protein [Rhodocyclaceae bacterium]